MLTETANFIQPELFKLLMKIKNEIVLQVVPYELSGSKLVDLISDQIIESGNRLELPIVRIANKFYIYDEDDVVLLPNRSMEKFLLMVCDQVGVSKSVMDSIQWRDQLFGAMWRRCYLDK